MIYSSFNFLQIKHPARVIILFVIIDNVIIRDFQSVRHEIFPGESFTLEGQRLVVDPVQLGTLYFLSGDNPFIFTRGKCWLTKCSVFHQ